MADRVAQTNIDRSDEQTRQQCRPRETRRANARVVPDSRARTRLVGAPAARPQPPDAEIVGGGSPWLCLCQIALHALFPRTPTSSAKSAQFDISQSTSPPTALALPLDIGTSACPAGQLSRQTT